MEIDRYEAEAHKHVHELLSMLRECDLAALAALCRDLGPDKMDAQIAERCNELLDFVAATPTRRKSSLRKEPAEQRSLYLLQAFYLARCGLAFLKMTAQYGVGPGPSYRMVSAQSARAALALRDEWPTLWPFSDYGDPFDEMPEEND